MSACRCLSPISLEDHLSCVEDLAGYWDTSLKQTSLLLYGEDLRYVQVWVTHLAWEWRRINAAF